MSKKINNNNMKPHCLFCGQVFWNYVLLYQKLPRFITSKTISSLFFSAFGGTGTNSGL